MYSVILICVVSIIHFLLLYKEKKNIYNNNRNVVIYYINIHPTLSTGLSTVNIDEYPQKAKNPYFIRISAMVKTVDIYFV